MVIKASPLRGILKLEILLIKYETLKQLFVFDIEDGFETFIPKELSQDHLPHSIRYYDPIISIVCERVSSNRREYFSLK